MSKGTRLGEFCIQENYVNLRILCAGQFCAQYSLILDLQCMKTAGGIVVSGFLEFLGIWKFLGIQLDFVLHAKLHLK